MLSGKVIIILLIIGQEKKIFYKMSYFPEPYSCNKNKVNVELDFYN